MGHTGFSTGFLLWLRVYACLPDACSVVLLVAVRWSSQLSSSLLSLVHDLLKQEGSGGELETSCWETLLIFRRKEGREESPSTTRLTGCVFPETCLAQGLSVILRQRAETTGLISQDDEL